MPDFDTSAMDAIDTARQLDQFGIELPTDAARWLEKLHELRASPPNEAPHNEIATLIAASAKLAAIDEAIAYRLGQNLRTGQHRHAQQIVGRRCLDAILDDRDRLHTELAVTANQLIGRLHQAALIDESVTDLTRQRRVDEAHMLAVAESDVAELSDLFKLRSAYLTPRQSRWLTGWYSCEVWSNPWAFGHIASNDGSKWGTWRATIRAGGELWFVPFEVAAAASTENEPADMIPPIDPRRRTGRMFAG